MGGIYQKTKEWVEEKYQNANHLVQTVYWVKVLDPQASQALILAALTHDIERAFAKDRHPPIDEFGGDWNNSVYCQWHSERSAKFVAEFLTELGESDGLITKVVELIQQHETGGNPEADILMNADSLSFLEVNCPMFISWIPQRCSKADVVQKIDYMYGRIKGAKAQTLAEPLYKKARGMLNDL